MRQFDTFQSYTDNLGDPLVGRVMFCNLDGSVARVYDKDGLPLANPILTDSAGRTSSQVFLEDHDYIVFFDKYIGNAVMTEDTEDESWLPQGSVVSRYNTVGIDVNVESGFQSIDDINTLREVNPEACYPIVAVLGYYEKGDKPMALYKWTPTSTKAHDGGAVVSSTFPGVTRGRWIMIQSYNFVDVRHFGAFPTAADSGDVEQRYAIQNASRYANSVGLGLFFHADSLGFNYDVSGLTLNGVDCSDNAVLYSSEDVDTHLTNVKSVHCSFNVDDGTGRMYIGGDRLKTSMNGNLDGRVVLKPYISIRFDTDYVMRNTPEFSDVDCILDVDQSVTMSFTRCSFLGNGKFKKETKFYFTDCLVKESMFEDYSSGYIILKNCYTNINEWSDTSKYIDCMVDSGANDIDLYGRKVEGNVDLSGSDISLRNGTIDGAVFCRSFRGENIVAGAVEAETYDMRNCETIVSGHLGSFKAHGCRLTIGNASISSNSEIVDSRITGANSVMRIRPTDGQIVNVMIENCEIEPYMWISAREDGKDADSDNIYVTSFIVKNNVMRNFLEFEKVVTEEGTYAGWSRSHFASRQGYYCIEDNVSSFGRIHPSTRLPIERKSWEGDLHFPVESYEDNLFNSQDAFGPILCLGKFVWSFGESENNVNYGCDSIRVIDIKLTWGSDGVLLQADPNEVGILSSTTSRIKENWFSRARMEPNQGHVPTSGKEHVELRFEPVTAPAVHYDDEPWLNA